jgi:hypothetical protein
VKKLLQYDRDGPQPERRRRSGKKEGGLCKPGQLTGKPAARGRYAALRGVMSNAKAVFASAAAITCYAIQCVSYVDSHLALDCMNPYWLPIADLIDDEIDNQIGAEQDRCFPQP